MYVHFLQLNCTKKYSEDILYIYTHTHLYTFLIITRRDRDRDRKRRRSKSRDKDRDREQRKRERRERRERERGGERLEYIKTDEGGEIRIKEEPIDGKFFLSSFFLVFFFRTQLVW